MVVARFGAPITRAPVLLSSWILTILAALFAQHPSPPDAIPAIVILASLLAILGGAILPSRWPVVPKDRIAAEPCRAWACLVAGSLILLGSLIAAAVWSQEPFRSFLVFTRPASSWAAVLWLTGIFGGLIVAWDPRRSGKNRSRSLIEPLGRVAEAPGRVAESRHPNQPSFDEATEGRSRAASRFRDAPGLWMEAVLLLVILLGALILRVWHLSAVPLGVGYDEADSALDAMALFHLPFQPLGPGNWGHNPSLYFYAMALIFKIGGASIGTARFTSVAFGVLGVGGVYLVGRQAGGAGLGLCAAALLAVSGWSLHFSRFAIMDIATPALVSLGLWALLLGLRRQSPFWFALSGCMFGLTIMTYAGGFISAVMVCGWLVVRRLATDVQWRRTGWPALVLLPLELIAAAMPFLIMLRLDPDYALWREHQMSLFSLVTGSHAQFDALISNLRAHLLMFTAAGDLSGANNLPGQPMLDLVTGTLFLIGIGMCIGRIGEWFPQMLLLWLGGNLLAGILSNPGEAPEAARTVGAVAPISLIAALPLFAAGQVVLEWARTRSNRAEAPGFGHPASVIDRAGLLAGIVVMGIVLVAGSLTARDYFGAYAVNPVAWQAMHGPMTLVGRAAPALIREGYQVRVDPGLLRIAPIYRFLAGVAPEAYNPAHPITRPVPRPGIVLVVLMSDQSLLTELRREFPGLTVRPLEPSFDPGAMGYCLVTVSAGNAGSNGTDP